MRFSLGKFPRNTISRLIKNFLPNFFFLETFFLYFPLRLFFIFTKLFYLSNFVPWNFFTQLGHTIRSCNLFVQLIRATRSGNFSSNSFMQLISTTFSCNFSYKFIPFLVNALIFPVDRFDFWIMWLLEAFGRKSWEPGHSTQFKGAESENHGSQAKFSVFNLLICISKWLPICKRKSDIHKSLIK